MGDETKKETDVEQVKEKLREMLSSLTDKEREELMRTLRDEFEQ